MPGIRDKTNDRRPGLRDKTNDLVPGAGVVDGEARGGEEDEGDPEAGQQGGGAAAAGGNCPKALSQYSLFSTGHAGPGAGSEAASEGGEASIAHLGSHSREQAPKNTTK